MNELIELSELRIWNVLLYKDALHYVSSLSMDIDDEYTDMIGVTPLGKTTGEKCDWNRALFGDLKRVELSEEWLLKFGFWKKEGSNVWNQGLGSYRYCIHQTGMEYPFDIRSHDSFSYFIDTPKYVHQLQNIFFALTGHELKLSK